MYLRCKITSLFFMAMAEENITQNSWFKRVEMPAYRQFLILIGMVCVGFLLASVLSFIIITSTSHVNLSNIAAGKNLSRPLMIWLLIIQDIFLFALPAFLFAKIVSIRNDYFYFKKTSSINLWLIALLIAFAAMPASDFFSQINEWIPISKHLQSIFKAAEQQYNSQAIAIIDVKSLGGFIISILIIALLPAIVEELIFRGSLQQVLLKWTGKAFPTILITAIIFSAVHLSYYGFLPRVLLGVVLGYVYYFGKNIWLNMFVHFINNASVVTFLYISSRSKPIDPKMMDSASAPFYMQIIGILVLIAALYSFYKNAKHQTNKL